MEAFAIPNQEATTVAEKLVEEVFMSFSILEQFHSDQSWQLVLTEIYNLLNIQKRRITPYHPKGDGLVERFNQTLLDMLATCTKDHSFE